jgi:glutathione S-transferase
MRLYEAKMAPHPRRVKIYLAEKGVELERVEVDLHAMENRSPAFLKKNPSGKIPVLELDSGAFLPESAAIIEYLEEIYPSPSMLGESPEQRAQTRATDRIAGEIFTVLAQMLMHTEPAALSPIARCLR